MVIIYSIVTYTQLFHYLQCSKEKQLKPCTTLVMLWNNLGKNRINPKLARPTLQLRPPLSRHHRQTLPPPPPRHGLQPRSCFPSSGGLAPPSSPTDASTQPFNHYTSSTSISQRLNLRTFVSRLYVIVVDLNPSFRHNGVNIQKLLSLTNWESWSGK